MTSASENEVYRALDAFIQECWRDPTPQTHSQGPLMDAGISQEGFHVETIDGRDLTFRELFKFQDPMVAVYYLGEAIKLGPPRWPEVFGWWECPWEYQTLLGLVSGKKPVGKRSLLQRSRHQKWLALTRQTGVLKALLAEKEAELDHLRVSSTLTLPPCDHTDGEGQTIEDSDYPCPICGENGELERLAR